ncbi:hypothetical protein [Desulfobacter curvatus]|uniref:hypothetical protein n=1 Tax=Desulfobacter curvatus TaxID=2290 RepID=UPI00037275DE|nr:hypothetical protein [Desulfobacter curvatus]
MRRIRNYSINKESTDNMIQAKRFNPCLEITFRDCSGQHTHKLSAGYGDDLDVYREGVETYILTTNPKLGYIGLEVFEGPDKTGEIFVEEHQVKEVIGRDDLAPFNAIKRLREHFHLIKANNQ